VACRLQTCSTKIESTEMANMTDEKQTGFPSRILYTMIRVGNLDKSIAFYKNALGMKELRRETFKGAGFTLVFMGYGDAESEPTIELTWNWDKSDYTHGTGYGHIALGVEDIYGLCDYLEQMGVNITRPAAPMLFAVDETGHKEVIAFIEDPDGYKIELIEMPKKLIQRKYPEEI